MTPNCLLKFNLMSTSLVIQDPQILNSNRQVSRMLQLRSGKSCAFANKSLRPERSFAFSAWTSTASPEYVCKQTQDVYTCGSAAS